MRAFLRYRTKQRGLDPNPDRPLRSEPVRREEVRFDDEWRGRGERVHALWTMPFGTFRREIRTVTYSGGGSYQVAWLVGDVGLWQPLWDALTTELAAEYAQRVRYFAEHPDLARMGGAPRERRLQPLPELREKSAREYTCEHCGGGYLGLELRGNQRVCVCSNRCEHDRANAQQRRWREHNPPDPERINAKRTAQRATARAGRVCEHCGQPFEAARSTRRFCSDICRVKAHRASATA